MSIPYMPWYHGDHLEDTAHLNHEQQWAYFLLINHYWAKGGLPDDDQQLACIARLPLAKWAKMRPVIHAFFRDGWKHGRVEIELATARERSATNRARARKAAKERWERQAADVAPAEAIPLAA